MSKRKFTNEYLINGLKELGSTLGRTPKVDDLKTCDYLPKHKTFAKYFGSWNNALLKAGFDLNMVKNYSKESIISEVKEFYSKNGRSPYYNELSFSNVIISHFWSSWDEMIKDLGLPTNRNMHNLKTKEDGIRFLKNVFNTTGKIPSANYISKELNMNRSWFTKTFGSYGKALYESGLVGIEYTYDKEVLVQESINIIKTFSQN